MKTETETLLYYSIPGFFVFFFVLSFAMAIGRSELLDIRTVTFVIASVIPVGFIVYQAYVRTIYVKIWATDGWFKIPDPCLSLIAEYVSQHTRNLDTSLADKIKKKTNSVHLLNFFVNESENQGIIDYSWRLINLINARGVGVFSCIVAVFVPIVYCVYAFVSGIWILPSPSSFMTQLLSVGSLMILSYYGLICVIAYVLESGIDRVRKHLADFNLSVLLVGKSMDEFVLAQVAMKSVCIAKDMLLDENKANLGVQKLIDEAIENLRKQEWQEALQKSSEAYRALKTK